MHLILMGCEWTGKSALGPKILAWWTELTGSPCKFHDHFTPPFQVQDNPTTDPRENDQVAALIPSLQEKFQRYQIEYHIRPFVRNDDLLVINHYYGDAVYAPMYYDYGEPGSFGDRQWLARYWDRDMIEVFPSTLLVMMTASPEVVRQRRRDDPRPNCPIQDQDIDRLLARFRKEFDTSLITRRFALDTTDMSPEETFHEFVRRNEPLLSEKDSIRILRHRALTR